MKILLSAVLPGATMAMCPAKQEKTVDCAAEARDPVSGTCIQPVHG